MTPSVSCLRGFVVACVLIAGSSSAFQPSAASAANGKRVFMTYYCYACHGTEGQGGAGPRLVMRATPDPLIRYVRKPTGTMPPYTSNVISEQELKDIYTFLRAIPASPAARDIPMLSK
jgi:mono/diheme cytochrome c family protein